MLCLSRLITLVESVLVSSLRSLERNEITNTIETNVINRYTGLYGVVVLILLQQLAVFG